MSGRATEVKTSSEREAESLGPTPMYPVTLLRMSQRVRKPTANILDKICWTKDFINPIKRRKSAFLQMGSK